MMLHLCLYHTSQSRTIHMRSNSAAGTELFECAHLKYTTSTAYSGQRGANKATAASNFVYSRLALIKTPSYFLELTVLLPTDSNYTTYLSLTSSSFMLD